MKKYFTQSSIINFLYLFTKLVHKDFFYLVKLNCRYFVLIYSVQAKSLR